MNDPRPSRRTAPPRRRTVGDATGETDAAGQTDRGGWTDHLARALALASALVLVGSFASVLYRVIDVVTDPTPLVVVVLAAVLAATVVARLLATRTALALTAVLLVGGLVGHLLTLPDTPSAAGLLVDLLRYLTGKSVLQIFNVEKWALGVAPAPAFATWYLALRRRYGLAALAGGSMLGFLVLSGDASVTTTLMGIVGATSTLGLGDLDRRGASLASADVLVVALAAMVVVPLTVTVVPSQTAAAGVVPSGGGDLSGESGTLETALVSNDQQVKLQGAISLSPDERFTVRSTAPGYWRVGAYDRYTGEGWVRTGESRPVENELPSPPGPTETVTQRYRLSAPLAAVPTVWRPVGFLGNVTASTERTSLGGLRPTRTLPAGTSYAVVSERPVVNRSTLAAAGGDYPARIERRYLQVPSTTPDRVSSLAARVTRNATTTYETARRVQSYLKSEKEYSLDVQKPEGDVVGGFLFEMEAGYCTYFASSMAVMLRTQGVPARVVTGYTPGERVAEDRWVVRGLQSHMWVEVYVPDIGWVRFDPTPAGPRTDAENERLQTAGLEANQTDPPRLQPLSPATPPRTPNASGNDSAGDVARTRTIPETDAAGGTGGWTYRPVDPETLALWTVVLAGAAVLTRRSGAWRRARSTLALRWQRRVDPATDVDVAFERLQRLLARRHRPRRPGESVQTYLDAVDADDRARRVAEVRERVVYGDADVTRATADEVVGLVDDLVRE